MEGRVRAGATFILFGEVGSKIVFVIFTKLFNLYDDESASPI